MFDLNLLRVLAAVIEQRTVTAAAEQLQISQPAVTQSLNRLRKITGDELFVKAGRGFASTRVAEQLYRDTSELVSRADAAVKGVTAFDPTTTTATFRISLTDIGQQVFLPTLAQSLRARAPLSRLEVMGPNTAIVSEQLTTGELDAAILSTRLNSRTRSEVLRHDKYLCIARAGLFSNPGPSLVDLKNQPRVAVTGSTGHTLVERHLSTPPRGSIVLSNFGSIPDVVASTDLIAFVPDVLTKTWVIEGDIDVWDMAEIDTRTEVRAYLPKTPKSSASAWFGEVVVTELRDAPLPRHKQHL